MSFNTFSCSRVFFKVLNHGVVAARGFNTGWRPRYPGPGGRAAPVRVLDLRSDAMTKPGPAMRQAMAESELGDDLLTRTDPTVDELQKIAADMFQMEAALFVPSTTMGNLIAVMAHCRERDDEMIVGDLSHLHIFEQGGSAQLAGVHATTATTLPNGTFDLEQLESKIRHGYPKSHYPRSRLICVENTHNIQGGRVLPLTFLKEVRAFADRYGLSVFMDGARVMNAAVALGVPLPTILQHTHTVSVSLSKGLGAPVGTMLAGPRDFIAQAVRCHKALGGHMLKTAMLAAAGKLSLLEMVGRLEEDHRNARTFAQALLDCDPPIFCIDMATVETNIVRFHMQPGLCPSEFCAHMAQVGEGEVAALGQGVQVRMIPFFANSIRAVWHLGISPEDTQLAIQKMQFVASQYLKEKVKA
ncbi:probable low-specificity L-threonine aldolase 2 isoform X1 [Sebastes umbrosus]|uniref:probable low-specificity L-threonine aldolase 2 isoform X1 n=1 Tax=Sebastes umbrosus TaxID=72105 RepID=UPI0018A0592C|nr:probable low-specificity L-threonine aldolase 2 isoform X1 [Sebastes umbrosus]